MKNFEIRETDLEEALKIFPKIKEFKKVEAGTVKYAKNKIGNSNHLILSAYVDGQNAGYLIAYQDDESFYCWVVGVDPHHRRIGILTEMMKLYEKSAKKYNCSKLKLKTKNDKREMLSYLIKHNWHFIQVIQRDDIIRNQIILEKTI